MTKVVDEKKLIIALDFDEKSDVLSLCNELDPKTCRVKIGKQLFTKYGPSIIDDVHNLDFEVFLDLKFHDIPTTVKKACIEAYKQKIWMLNIHLLGGIEMVQAAKEARDIHSPNSKLIGVTLLTSHKINDFQTFGLSERTNIVSQLTQIAIEANIDGIVCSPSDIPNLNIKNEEFMKVTPGIRLENTSHDHSSIFTPSKAVELGSTHLVVGRPITESESPKAIVEEINSSII